MLLQFSRAQSYLLSRVFTSTINSVAAHTSIPATIETLVPITDRFAMGRSIFTGKEVRAICKHYNSNPDTGPRSSLHAVKFVKNACIPFASAQVKQNLASLPKADNRATLSGYMNILSADGALARLQVEYEARPEALFFVGEMVPCSQNPFHPPKNEWPDQIPNELTQSALEILRRYCDDETSFSARDVQVLSTYQKHLSGRGADMWLSLALFFRDAAHPLASPSLRAKHVAFSEESDTTVIVNQYYDLVRDGAVSRLIQRVLHLPHEQVQVKADDMPHGNSISEYASDHEQDCQHPGKKARQTSENSKRPFQSTSPAPEQAPSTRNPGFSIPRVGTVNPQGLALPSYAGRKKGKGMKKIFSRLTPRQIRDLIRQYDPVDRRTRIELRKNAEVFYVGGNSAFQLKPHYLWVLVQELEQDELAITQAQKDAIFPTWREALGLSLVQRSPATHPANRSHSPDQIASSVSTEYTGIFQRMESKLDHLTNRVNTEAGIAQRTELKITHLTDQVAGFITENATLKKSIFELTSQVNELIALSIQYQDKTVTKKSPEIPTQPNECNLPLGKKYGLFSDSEDIHSQCLDAPLQEIIAEVNNEAEEAEETERPKEHSYSRNKRRLLPGMDSVSSEVSIQPIAKRVRRPSGDNRLRLTRAAGTPKAAR